MTLAEARVRLVALARAAATEPADPPPPPGANLEPGFRRRWLWFWLPLTFAAFWLLTFLVGFNWETVGIDARIYHNGSAAWLDGGNPWASGALLNGRPFSYAGLPPTVLLLAPLAWLPEEAFVWLWLALSVGAALLIVRSLRLPWVWVAYPPLLYGVIAANPHVLLLALLLANRWRLRAAGTVGGAVASVVKVVALPPLVGERRWRAVLLGLAAIGLTVPLVPDLWRSFLDQAGTVSDAIHTESSGGVSAWGQPVLMAATLAALAVLAVLDFRAAGWLVVPALFPTTQYYYAMFALPVDPFLAAGAAFPVAGAPAYLTIAYAVVRLVRVGYRKRGTRMGDAEVVPPT